MQRGARLGLAVLAVVLAIAGAAVYDIGPSAAVGRQVTL